MQQSEEFQNYLKSCDLETLQRELTGNKSIEAYYKEFQSVCKMKEQNQIHQSVQPEGNVLY